MLDAWLAIHVDSNVCAGLRRATHSVTTLKACACCVARGPGPTTQHASACCNLWLAWLQYCDGTTVLHAWPCIGLHWLACVVCLTTMLQSLRARQRMLFTSQHTTSALGACLCYVIYPAVISDCVLTDACCLTGASLLDGLLEILAYFGCWR